MRRIPVREVQQEGASGTHAAPPNIGIRSTDGKAWAREDRFDLHVAGLRIAVHNAEDGIRAIVMGEALDRSAGRYLRIVLLQPRVQRFQGGISHGGGYVYV